MAKKISVTLSFDTLSPFVGMVIATKNSKSGAGTLHIAQEKAPTNEEALGRLVLSVRQYVSNVLDININDIQFSISDK